SILTHPFYRAWTAGALRRADLQVYATDYYPHVAAFPGYLERAIAGADSAEVRSLLLDNLRDEMAVPAPHASLWLAYARATGADPDHLTAAPPSEATAATIETFRRLCSADSGSALAALYAYESQQPEVSRQKADGLRRHYGIRDATELAYFEVHA